MKKLLLAVVALALLMPSAFAVPRLQVYIPGAGYDSASDTWVTHDQDFELWVVAANLNQGQIHNVTLSAALAGGVAPVDGGLQITNAANVTRTFNASDFMYGTPPATGDDAGDLPGHGIFPTHYTEMLVTGVTGTPYSVVNDYTSSGGGSNAYGNIFKFNVHTTYSYVHFDAYGWYRSDDGKFVFAPFSHDGETDSKTPVPEPATMLLMGLGLAGAGVVKKLRK